MISKWLKSRMPSGLYGRAALILLLPIATLQLSLTIDFTHRYFTDVTEQLTENTALGLTTLYEAHQRGLTEEANRLAEALQIDVQPVSEDALPDSNGRKLFDISGLQVEGVFRRHFPDLAGIWLGERREVQLFLRVDEQILQMSFPRNRVSPANSHQFILATFLIAVLMAFIAAIFLRNQLKPIAQLGEAAEAFGRGVSLPYHERGASEVRAAGRAFLAMRDRIERHIDQRTLMLTSISHDLRTPLTRLRLACAMLPEDQGEAMSRDIDDMTRMIDGFLAFAREDVDNTPSEQIELMSFLDDIVATAKRSGQNVTFCKGQEALEIKGRASDIRRAIDNLLSNASHFAKHIEVTIHHRDTHIQINVEDDGPGIPEEDFERALNPFERLDAARSQRHEGGSGLGLAIVADIARAHGGQLVLGRSERLGGLKAQFSIAV